MTMTRIPIPRWVTVVDTPGFGNTLQEEVTLMIIIVTLTMIIMALIIIIGFNF